MSSGALGPPPCTAPKPVAGGGPIVMVGKLHAEKSTFSGIWAMTKAELKQKGKNEPFELSLEDQSVRNSWEPSAGSYSGHFYFQEAQGRKKVVDNCTLRFLRNSAGGLNVEGIGRSDYGPYSVTGVIEKPKNEGFSCSMTMWRIAVTEAQAALANNVVDSNLKLASKTLSVKLPSNANEDIHSNRKKVTDANSSNFSTAHTSKNTAKEYSMNEAEKEEFLADEYENGRLSADEDDEKVQGTGEEKEDLLTNENEAGDLAEEEFDWMKVSYAIHEYLWNQPEAIRWFRRPVDSVRDNAVDYDTIITNPMDLGTIKEKLDQQEYATMVDFVEDCKLVFQNAVTYNPDPESGPHKDAQSLMERMDQKLDEHVDVMYINESNEEAEVESNAEAESDDHGEAEGEVSGELENVDIEADEEVSGEADAYDGGAGEAEVGGDPDSANEGENDHVKVPKMQDSELEGLQDGITRLFEKQNTNRDRAYACAVWQLVMACVPKDCRYVEDEFHVISLEAVPKIHQHQLAELVSRWETCNDPTHTEDSTAQSMELEESSELLPDKAEPNRKRARVSTVELEVQSSPNKTVVQSAGSAIMQYDDTEVQAEDEYETRLDSTITFVSEVGVPITVASMKSMDEEKNEPFVMPILKVITADEPPPDLGATIDDWDIATNEYGSDGELLANNNSDWAIARREKAERERRLRERAEAEKSALKAQEIAAAKQEAETRRDILAASKRAAELELARKEELIRNAEEAKIAEEQNRKDLERLREELGADVDLDEVRGNQELMKLMNGIL